MYMFPCVHDYITRKLKCRKGFAGLLDVLKKQNSLTLDIYTWLPYHQSTYAKLNLMFE